MNSFLFFIGAIIISLISYLVYLRNVIQEKDKIIKEKDIDIKEKDIDIKEKDKLIEDPDFNKRQAMLAFNEAEEWRKNKVSEIYDQVLDEELDHAVRWIKYAEPFAEYRSCLSTANTWSKLVDLESMWEKMQTIASPDFFWNDTCRKGMLALHSFHTTGIEGNTLTLSETMLVIDNKPLLAGFPDEEKFLTPVTSNSLNEVRNIKRILDALKFPNPPTLSVDVLSFSKQLLVDINTAILGSTSDTAPFRNHPVAVGHQKIVLPMPDEVNYLVDLYIDWVNKELHLLRSNLDESSPENIVVKALSLACDAHTKLVHIHPFSDGNGRLARILSGLVLRRVLLPLPLFLKEGRHDYIKAVSISTIFGDSTVLCKMHAEAVMRSMDAMINLSNNYCLIP
jgi:hypothetical protein